MKNENFITVLGFMVNDLKLSGNELLLYALIHGFSQDGESRFTGSLTYIQKCLNLKSKTTVINLINSLISKDLITKNTVKINGTKYSEYFSNWYGGTKNVPVQKLVQGGTKNVPNNNSYNNSILSFARENDFNTDEISEITSAWNDWLKMRKEIKKPVNSERVENRATNRLTKLALEHKQNTNTRLTLCGIMVEMIDEAVFKKWQDFYPTEKMKNENSRSNSSGASRNSDRNFRGNNNQTQQDSKGTYSTTGDERTGYSAV